MKASGKGSTFKELQAGVKIFENVEVGKDCAIYPPSVMGMPPKGKKEGDFALKIGSGAIIRPFTTLYAGSTIGRNLRTGQCVTIREENNIGDDVSIGTGSSVEFGNIIGDRVRIHSICFLEMVVIEEDVFIGPGVVFADDPHPPCPKFRECVGGARVGKGARIGAGCTILPGVSIGAGSLIGAGSVVTRDVPPGSVVAGNPAKVVKRLDELKCQKGFYPRPYSWLE